MKLARLFTEDIRREKIEFIVSTRFEGCTLIEATGYWRGKPEKSLCVEIAQTDESLQVFKRNVDAVARQICIANNQEAVFVQYLEFTGGLVYAS